MSAAFASWAPAGSSSDRESDDVPKALVRRSSVRSVARGDNDTVSLVDASTLTSGVSVAGWFEDGWRQMSKTGIWKRVADLPPMHLLSARTHRLLQSCLELRFLYIALFEPGKYMPRQVVLGLVGICQRGQAIYEGREFIVDRVEGWHLGEQDGFGRERGNGREVQ